MRCFGDFGADSRGHYFRAGELKGEWAVEIGRALGEEGVQTDAGPFDLVEGSEEGEALVKGVGIWKEGDGFFEEKSGEVFWEEAVGLVGEVDEGFCGVVPAGIFEIDIAECAIRLPERVVEAEVGGREAALRGREDFAAGGIWDVFDSFAKLVPEWKKSAANEEHGLLMVLAGGLNLLKAVGKAVLEASLLMSVPWLRAAWVDSLSITVIKSPTW
jgi:hypothetical protein